MIFSVLFSSLAFESEAAETNVVNDLNGDGQFTLDEVDLLELVTYELLYDYGVIGKDLSGSISSNSVYTAALEEVTGAENTIIVGTVSKDTCIFSDWFVDLIGNIFSDMSSFTNAKYHVFPQWTRDDLLEWFNNNTSGSAYTNYLNFMQTTDLTNRVVTFSGPAMYLWSGGYDSACYYYNDGNHVYGVYLDENGSTQTKYWASLSYVVLDGSYYSTASRQWLDCAIWAGIDTRQIYAFDGPILFFSSREYAVRFLNQSLDLYFASKPEAKVSDCLVSRLNSAWSDISDDLYSTISTAIIDGNNASAQVVQNTIDQKIEEFKETVVEEEENNNGEGSDGNNNVILDPELSNKLDQNNQLQQESNQLQEENNALQEESNQLQEESNALQEEENETSKGILGKITEFFGSFFQNLIDSVVGIFVPDQEDMQANFERLDQFFSDTFGFLYYPFDFLIEVVNIFLSADSGTSLTFPGFSIMGHEVWSDQSFDLTSIDVVNTIFETVRLVTGGVLAFAFINYLRSFFDKRFGGGGA